MFVEPGIMESAKAAGIKKGAMIDANQDGKLDGTDLNINRTNMQPVVLAKANVIKTPASC